MDTQTGKFIAGAKPINAVTGAMIIQRAKELAVINGRTGDDYTPADFEQARRELTGFVANDATDAENDTPDTGGWLGEAGDRGKKAPVRRPNDEQRVGEDLVKEGVEEATHHTMLAGSEQRARRDQLEE